VNDVAAAQRGLRAFVKAYESAAGDPSHGVGTDSCATCVGGIAATNADRVRSAAASRPRRCARVAAASYAGRKAGQMKPPSCDAARSIPRCCETSIRCVAESFVQVIDAPWRSAMRSTSRLTETGRAMRAFGIVEQTSSTITSNA